MTPPDTLNRFVLSEDDPLFQGKGRIVFAFNAGTNDLKWARKDCPHCYATFSVVKLRKHWRCSVCRKYVK